jgi:hypothetical protein
MAPVKRSLWDRRAPSKSRSMVKARTKAPLEG